MVFFFQESFLREFGEFALFHFELQVAFSQHFRHIGRHIRIQKKHISIIQNHMIQIGSFEDVDGLRALH